MNVSKNIRRKVRPAARVARQNNLQGWLSVLPVLLVIAAVRGYPLLVGFQKSFTNWDGMTRSDFVGLQNYIRVLSDLEFWKLLSNNAIFMLFIPIQLVIGITVSVLFYEKTAGWKFFRSVFYLPQMISSVIVGYLFAVFFSFRGPINTILSSLGLEALTRDWLGQRASALMIIMVCLVWVNIGWQAMLGLGGLASVDPGIFEAAKIDGAGYFQRLFFITIPMLGRTIEYSCIMSVIWVLSGLFPYIFSMTKGGPGYDTTTIDYMVYLKSFGTSSEMGYASALAFILLLIIMLLTIGQMKLSNRANDWGE